jgi:hypothetical protein
MDLAYALGGLVAVVVLVVLLARSRARNDDKDRRGTEPGEGDQLIDNAYYSGGLGGGHGDVTRVPRDPQEYAKAFVPPDAPKDTDDEPRE